MWPLVRGTSRRIFTRVPFSGPISRPRIGAQKLPSFVAFCRTAGWPGLSSYCGFAALGGSLALQKRPCIWDRLWLKFQDAFRQVPPLNLDLRGSPWGSSVGTKWVITWSPWKIWRRRLEHFDRSNGPVKMALTPGLRETPGGFKIWQLRGFLVRATAGPPRLSDETKTCAGELVRATAGPPGFRRSRSGVEPACSYAKRPI